jgi:hypothetical protein
MTIDRAITVASLLVLLWGGCKKADDSPSTTAARAEGRASAGPGCQHDFETHVVVKHTWPYPADVKDLRWVDRYTKVKLRLKPVHAAFFTATHTYKKGDYIHVEDSQVHILKPRRLVAKRDLYVQRKVWDQGTQVQQRALAVAKGEVGSFLFYNSRGMCMLDTDQGPGWTPCTLDDAFEGLSAESPFACEEVWWVKVVRSKVEQGWMPFDPALMERVSSMNDGAK